MRATDPRPTIRRANPIFMLAVGVLVGAMLAAIAQRPASDEALAATGGSATASGGRTATTGGSLEGVDPGAVADGAGAAQGATAGPGETDATAAAAGGGEPGAVGDPCAAPPSSGVQGVTDDTVKIGFALPDMSVLAATNSAYELGDLRAQVEAVLKGMRSTGRLPVCGRDIVPAFRTFNILDPSQSRAACVGFADEDKVFAVVSLVGFSAGECVTVEKKLFLLDLGPALSEQMFRNSPLLFSTGPPIEVSLRALAHSLVDNGLVQGKKVGVYYNTSGPGGSSPPGEAVQTHFVDLLAQLGHPVDVVVVTDTTATTGDPNDGIAVQRFKAAGVEVAVPLTGRANFYRQAQLQAYRAQWIVLGVPAATDIETKQYPADTFDGAMGLLFDHVGEEASGVPPTAEIQQCFGFWNAAGQQSPPRDSLQGQMIRLSCDQIGLITRAMGAAGRNLTHGSLVAGMETIRDVPVAYSSDQTFGPQKHWGATRNIVERWDKACTCWKVAAPWAPLNAG